jgi:putative nucleotidyltransferase with HDIG domain
MLSSFDIPELANEQSTEAIESLQHALESRDLNTHLHSIRVVCYAARLGRVLGLTPAQLSTLQVGVLLHDIGKVHVPDAILRKPGPLTDDEWKVMRRHSTLGHGMVSAVSCLREAASIVLSHHERFDGTGYPHGLKGDDIPLAARILSVMDAFDAMTAEDRPYREPFSIETAAEQIRLAAGTQFDPAVVEAFQAVRLPEWQLLRQSMVRRMHLGQ